MSLENKISCSLAALVFAHYFRSLQCIVIAQGKPKAHFHGAGDCGENPGVYRGWEVTSGQDI